MFSTIENLPDASVATCGLKSPTLLIVGATVKLSPWWRGETERAASRAERFPGVRPSDGFAVRGHEGVVHGALADAREAPGDGKRGRGTRGGGRPVARAVTDLVFFGL